MNTHQRSITPRIKDLIILSICTVVSLVIFLLGNMFAFATDGGTLSAGQPRNPYLFLIGGESFRNLYDTFFVWVAAVGLLLCLYVSFLESRDKDAFVTGKTQSLGVMNSFVGITVVITIASYSILSWLIIDIIVCLLVFFARELGRRFSDKKVLKYVGQSGVLLTDLHNHGTAQISDKHLKVWSRQDMKQGDIVEITELKGNYLYVKKL